MFGTVLHRDIVKLLLSSCKVSKNSTPSHDQKKRESLLLEPLIEHYHDFLDLVCIDTLIVTEDDFYFVIDSYIIFVSIFENLRHLDREFRSSS